MPVNKILSKHYLEFLGKIGKSVTGKRGGVIELHHESIFPRFRGSMKKYNDYGALPLLKSEHVDRHAQGDTWWETVGLDPHKEVLRLLEEYQAALSPFAFLGKNGEKEYENEVERVEEHIGILQDMLVELNS